MDWTSALAPFVHGLEGQVLDQLYRVSAPQTAGEIRRRGAARASLSGVRKVLDRLVEQGVVAVTTVGGVVGHRLNTEHLAYPAIAAALDAYRPYALLRTRLRDLVVDATGSEHPPSVALYGSVTRHEATTDSDVDILVVAPADRSRDPQEVFELVPLLYDQVPRWTGNRAQVVATTVADLLSAHRAGDPFTASLAAEADTVVGPDVRELLGARGAS